MLSKREARGSSSLLRLPAPWVRFMDSCRALGPLEWWRPSGPLSQFGASGSPSARPHHELEELPRVPVAQLRLQFPSLLQASGSSSTISVRITERDFLGRTNHFSLNGTDTQTSTPSGSWSRIVNRNLSPYSLCRRLRTLEIPIP